jgi:hypothetical protein
MIEALNDKDVRFYIHIDKKAKENYNSTYKNVRIIPEHININWGGFTMVKATLALMEYGIKDFPDADYFILISGVDYPIRKKEFLIKQLDKRKEYIDIAPVPVPYKPVERYQHYFFDFKRRNAKLHHPLVFTEIMLKKIGVTRKPPFKVYAGTQWFALTRDCIRYILHTVKTDKRYTEFFKYTLVPDEAFFQTIIGNSPYMENTAANLTYTDWTVPEPPATIEPKHIEFLKTHIEFNDEYGQRFPYFARKFNDNSEPVLEMIRKELWK